MDVRGTGRFAALKTALGQRQLDRRMAGVLHGGVFLLLGLTLSSARVLNDGAPFGIAMTAAAGPGLAGVCTLLGAALGYLSGGLSWGIRYVAASVLVYTIGFVFQETSLYRRRLFMPGAAGIVTVMTAVMGTYGLTKGGLPLYARFAVESCLAFGGCYFFREVFSREKAVSESDEQRRGAAVMVLVAALLMAVSRITILRGASIGRAAALLLVMCCAMKGGILTGAAVGTVLGLAMDLTTVGAAYYTPIYAISGLLGGCFGRYGRFLFTLGFVLTQGVALIGLWNEGAIISSLYEGMMASLVFLLLPASMLSRTGLLLQTMETGSGELGLRRYMASRLGELGHVYEDIYETVRQNLTGGQNDENIARVFDRAADAVCVSCKEKNRCWNTDYMDTLSAMNDATGAMRRNGSLSAEDIPAHFREKCPSVPAFVAAVNGELRASAYRRQLRSTAAENRSAAWEQYHDMAGMLDRLSRELGDESGSEPQAEQRLQRYLRSLDIEAQTAVFRSGGRLRVIMEGPSLARLFKEEHYLDRISEVLGVRLCQPQELESSTSRLTLLEAEPLAVSVGIAAMKKKGESVNGDKGSYFKTDEGVLCVILSDGMGSGSEAARDSARVVEILERFLRSGTEPAIAMRILNSVMLLRSGEEWGYATVDLMCVDLFSGEACFYKYGAAPSYVKNGNKIRRIESESLAPGLCPGDGSAPDVVRMKLRPGSTALIATDGVIAARDDEWLRELLKDGRPDMKGLAKTALRAAEEQYGAVDDMTVIAVRLDKRV